MVSIFTLKRSDKVPFPPFRKHCSFREYHYSHVVAHMNISSTQKGNYLVMIFKNFAVDRPRWKEGRRAHDKPRDCESVTYLQEPWKSCLGRRLKKSEENNLCQMFLPLWKILVIDLLSHCRPFYKCLTG